MHNAVDKEQLDFLARALVALESTEECERLLSDICTIKELQDMAQRLQVARYLRKKTTYTDIAARVGASTATISRVNRALSYGEGGYEMILSRIEDEDND